MPAGRPSKYSPAYCEEAVNCLAEGRSITAFAGRIGVARSTVFEWVSQHQEFSDAIKVGQAKAVDFWETRLVEFSKGGPGNATAIIFGLKNRAADDWADRQEVTGAGGKDLIPVPADRELARLLAFKLLQAERETEPK